jgi:hypothetical protein
MERRVKYWREFVKRRGDESSVKAVIANRLKVRPVSALASRIKNNKRPPAKNNDTPDGTDRMRFKKFLCIKSPFLRKITHHHTGQDTVNTAFFVKVRGLNTGKISVIRFPRI